jgi:hypothetical protein
MKDLPSPPRRRFRRSWYVVGGFFLSIYVFGFLGFREHARAAVPPLDRSWLDTAYLTGQLFTLESGVVPGPVPWKLEVARFLAPVAAAVALIQALVSSFSFHLSRIWLRIRGGHIIVAGLGEKGAILVRELMRRGRRVVVIESDLGNASLGECRQLGALVVTGRADDPLVLQRACTFSASELIATSGSDSVNLEAATLAKRICANRPPVRPPLRCIVHVSEPALQEALKRHSPFANESAVTLDVVNILQTGARVMIERSRVFSMLPQEGERCRILLLGLGSFGGALLSRLLRDWAILRAEAAGKRSIGLLEITLVDLRSSEKAPALTRHFGSLLEGVELNFFDGDATERDRIPTSGINAAFVCFNNDALATLAALRLGERVEPGCPVLIRMVEKAGFSSLLRETGAAHAVEACRPGFQCCLLGLGDITEMSELFLHGDREVLARAFHTAYLAERSGTEGVNRKDPSLVPWEDLSEFLRNSNRAAADGVPARLAAADLRAIPSPDRPIPLPELTTSEVAALAKHEHERWCAERIALGFRHGPKKDERAKTHPLLRAWETLSPEEQAYNLADSRRLPFVLARADLEVARADSV